MAGMHRLSTTAAVLVCFVVVQSAGATLYASEGESSPGAAVSTPSPVIAPFETPVEHLRMTLRNQILAAPAPIGSAPVWLNAGPLAPGGTGTLASRRGLFWGRGDRNEGARTALVLGTIATITGAALLVYANRPECSENGAASGCSYGTKVVGGAVASAGLVGIVAGALTWR